MSRVIGLRQVLSDPDGVATSLMAEHSVYGLVDVDVRIRKPGLACLWMTLEPWPPMADEGYPIERVAISVFAAGPVRAVPIGAKGRRWEHRNPYRLGSLDYLGDLCLWYPGDPDPLKWSWSDGFVDYITIVHRHLLAEEFWRRHGVWPAEAAPHGEGNHPIQSAELRRVVTEVAA